MVKQNMLPQKMNDEQIEKGSGKLQERWWQSHCLKWEKSRLLMSIKSQQLN
jgi:hypothetical protein